MAVKTVVLVLLTVMFVLRMLLNLVHVRSFRNPIPDCVRDVYDAETYGRWLNYSADKMRLHCVMDAVGWLVTMLLFGLDVYAKAANAIGGFWGGLFAVVAISVLTDVITGIPGSYVNDMVIEERYGFNRSTMKTFVSDQIKELIISLLLMSVLIAAFALIHRALGDWVIVLFAGVVFVLMLAISFLYPVLSKLFNRFTELEDGELREKLTALLTKHGYRVRGIKVMDASRRTTKSNAYFTGFGRMKTIVLYDTLIANMDADEICAVFAHELGHGLHRDAVKQQILNLGNMFLMAVMLWIAARTPELHTAFGFGGVNYAFAFLLASNVAFEPVLGLYGILSAWYSRRAEYAADAQAVKEGYGDTMVRALKKITAENFGHLAPSKLIVALEYSHPPLAERIRAIREAQKH